MVGIKQYDKIIPDAYHGTSKENAESIKINGFESSRGDEQFAGDGVYFFENSIGHAKDWARKHHGAGKFSKISVFQATINLGKCLDLAANLEHRSIIRKIYDKLKQRGKKVTDAVVINYFALNFVRDLDTVRICYLNLDFRKIFPESRFYDYNQIIICVRNNDRIIHPKVVYEEVIQ